jgi:hypothetical protein
MDINTTELRLAPNAQCRALLFARGGSGLFGTKEPKISKPRRLHQAPCPRPADDGLFASALTES